jgi:hypothetical protein
MLDLTQLVVNLVFVIFGGTFLWVLRSIWNAQLQNQQDLRDVADNAAKANELTRSKITELAISVPEKYVTKTDFHRTLTRIMNKLDIIEARK